MVRNVVQDSVYLSGVPRPGYRQIADSLWVNPSVDTIMARKIIRSYDPGRRGRYLYNDTNMYLLRLIAERITGRTLAAIHRRTVCRTGVYRHRIPAARMDLARAYCTDLKTINY